MNNITADNYIEVNRALWDEKTTFHTKSAFYRMDEFLQGSTSLNDIELSLLGDIAHKSILHLQCHFGQDTLSLARMGAKATGVDFSGEAIRTAQQLNVQLGLDASFLCTDIYSLPDHLDQQFDIVFTSYGTIGWLPDMKKWATVVSRFLKPGGFFLIVDFHPVIWMFDYGFNSVQHSYFNKEAIIEVHDGTYADPTANIKKAEIGWNHSLSEVMQNLLEEGLTMCSFQEFDCSPYNCFSKMTEVAPGKFQIQSLEGKLPLVYALKMTKAIATK